ncbi:MAG: hypothetical protein PXY39_05640 [archaeon]|nr:hypothetical protein [archaeon]
MAALDLNLVLLIVELILLAPTLLLLIMGRREERGRRMLLTEISKTAKMVSRQEYFNHVESAMQNAKESIKGSITGSPPKLHDQEDQIRRISTQITTTKKRNVSIQYLFPKLQDRLTVASIYKDAGAEIRFHPGLIVNDLRYVVFDQKYTVIGLPGHVGRNEPTRDGYYIPSEGLASIFAQQFDAKWAEATNYDDYLKAIISEAKNHSPNVSTSLLSEELKIPEGEVKRILLDTKS